MKATVSSMVWLDKSRLSATSLAQLKKQFTLRTTALFGAPGEEVRGYAETDKWLGVPRAVPYNGIELVDATVCEGIEWPELQFPNGGTYRPGQKDAIDTIVRHYLQGGQNARLEAKCGAGKSICSLIVASELEARTLVIVHKEDLAEQWREEAAEFFPGVTLGHVQGDVWRYKDAHITTALAQTLYSRKGAYPEDFIKSFDMVVVDEGHRFASSTFSYCLKMIPAKYRLAVSATWRRKDGLERMFDWHFGPVVAKMTTTSMVGQYALLPYTGRVALNPKMPWARKLNALAADASYNTWLAKEAAKAASNERRVLVVSDRIAQLEFIASVLSRELAYPATYSLFVGALSAPQREAAKKADVILATYSMMAEGTDVPELDTLFVASPRSDMEQTVGRIQRLRKGKKPLLIIDPYIPYDKLMLTTAGKRQGWYEQLGFSQWTPKK